ncbi:MAG: ornithine carbamoyltransferase [Pirellulales bacterium]|nr:ornithine carbamoyltransferase [Pirellulales bacterium]
MRHLLSITDLRPAEVEAIFSITRDLKSKHAEGLREPLLPGRVMALLFEKPSLRTRVSFESGMIQLGGGSLFLTEDSGFNSQRESLADFGRVLSQFVDVIVVRAKAHKTVEELARHSACAVINGLTDLCHPCQALADLYTLQELVGPLAGQRLTYIGDANNVARSLLELCGYLGVKFVMATPSNYQFAPEELTKLRRLIPGLDITVTTDPRSAVRGAAAVYTDVWTSMGQEAESTQRRADFAAYQVNAALLQAAPEAYFMHCLPAHRGEEVTDEVIDGPRSIVVQQAGNRLHVQKGILAWLLSRG